MSLIEKPAHDDSFDQLEREVNRNPEDFIMITLRCKDEDGTFKDFTISKSKGMYSEYIKNFLEDFSDVDDIVDFSLIDPVKLQFEVRPKHLQYLIEMLNEYDPDKFPEPDEDSPIQRTPTDFEEKFLDNFASKLDEMSAKRATPLTDNEREDLQKQELLELLLFSDFIVCKPFMDVIARLCGTVVQSKSSEEIRKWFNR